MDDPHQYRLKCEDMLGVNDESPLADLNNGVRHSTGGGGLGGVADLPPPPPVTVTTTNTNNGLDMNPSQA